MHCVVTSYYYLALNIRIMQFFAILFDYLKLDKHHIFEFYISIQFDSFIL